MGDINGITELALLLKERDNGTGYSPMFGKIIELPNLRIRLSDKVIINDKYIKKCIDINLTDSYGRYIYLNKEVVLLPYNNNQNFVLIGVVT